jgi:N6-adenosine-specific RNA methylase IME4
MKRTSVHQRRRRLTKPGRIVTPAAAVLVADPPWRHGDQLPGPGRGASKHYQTMSVEEICAFKLPPLANDCWLFLWRVSSMPREALDVVNAWGFVPKSELVWRKMTNDGSRVRIGMGRSVRLCHEACIIAKRGRPTRIEANVPSVFDAPRGGKHSAKPDAFYRIVERLAPGPYVELFARRHRPGWHCFGDELPADPA